MSGLRPVTALLLLGHPADLRSDVESLRWSLASSGVFYRVEVVRTTELDRLTGLGFAGARVTLFLLPREYAARDGDSPEARALLAPVVERALATLPDASRVEASLRDRFEFALLGEPVAATSESEYAALTHDDVAEDLEEAARVADLAALGEDPAAWSAAGVEPRVASTYSRLGLTPEEGAAFDRGVLAAIRDGSTPSLDDGPAAHLVPAVLVPAARSVVGRRPGTTLEEAAGAVARAGADPERAAALLGPLP